MAEPKDEATREIYLEISRWRQTERKHVLDMMHEMIDAAGKKAKSKRLPASERIRWTRLTDQLIWYKDSILKNMTKEATEVELSKLKYDLGITPGKKEGKPEESVVLKSQFHQTPIDKTKENRIHSAEDRAGEA